MLISLNWVLKLIYNSVALLESQYIKDPISGGLAALNPQHLEIRVRYSRSSDYFIFFVVSFILSV